MVKITRRAKDPNRLTKIELCAILNRLEISNITVQSTKKDIISVFKRNKKSIEQNQAKTIQILKELDIAKSKDKVPKKIEKRKRGDTSDTPATKRGKKEVLKEPAQEPKELGIEKAASVEKTGKESILSEESAAVPAEMLKPKKTEKPRSQEIKKVASTALQGVLSKSMKKNKEAAAQPIEAAKKKVERKQTNKEVDLATRVNIYIQKMYTKCMVFANGYGRLIVIGATIGIVAVLATYTLSIDQDKKAPGVVESVKNYVMNKVHDRNQKSPAIKHKTEEIAKVKKELEKVQRDIELKRQQEAIQKAKDEADRKAKDEAAQKAKEEAALKAKEEADRKAKEEAAQKAKVEADRKAKEEAELKAKEEAAQKAKEEADRKAKEEADRK
ncbi:hypothetical protein NEAUS04_2649, partial [Nematocida ausubeli]